LLEHLGEKSMYKINEIFEYNIKKRRMIIHEIKNT